MRKIVGYLVVIGCVTSACAWVEVEEEAHVVDVRRSEAEVAGCEARGTVSAQTQPRIGFVSRDATTVAVELERLARNRAVRMGGDVIVPTGPIGGDGTRSYSVWRCPDA